MFFVTPNRNMFAGKLVKSERFRLALRLSARKSEIKKTDDVHWNMWANIKKLYARNNILKKSSKYEILNHLYFGPNFDFWGTALWRFSQGLFFQFWDVVQPWLSTFLLSIFGKILKSLIINIVFKSWKLLAWCRSGNRTLGPATSGPWDRGSGIPLKV